MFLEKPGAKDVVLEFRSFKKDGSAVTFAVLDRPVTKAEDRLPDDMLATERPRPRATVSVHVESHVRRGDRAGEGVPQARADRLRNHVVRAVQDDGRVDLDRC